MTTTQETTPRASRQSDGITFEDWMARVNRIAERALGLTTDNFEDYSWIDCYEDNMTPRQAFDMAQGEGWPEA